MSEHTHDPRCATAHGETAAPETPARRLLVVYASPLGSYLLHWGRELGFTTTLLEPDPASVTRSHRAAADGVVHHPATVEVSGDLDVVVTDHHRTDLGPVLAPLVTARPRSIGIIGSPRHTGPHEAALAEQGVAADLVATVRRPIGLDIGSRTPAEIALSILAGLVADHSGRDGGRPESAARVGA